MEIHQTRSRVIHRVTETIHGADVQAFVHATPGSNGRPQPHIAVAKANDVMADLHAGGLRLIQGESVVPVPFADHELVECPYSSDWLAAVVVGGEGIMIRTKCDNVEDARNKLGVMVAHLHAGNTRTNAEKRVADHTAKQSPDDAAP